MHKILPTKENNSITGTSSTLFAHNVVYRILHVVKSIVRLTVTFWIRPSFFFFLILMQPWWIWYSKNSPYWIDGFVVLFWNYLSFTCFKFFSESSLSIGSIYMVLYFFSEQTLFKTNEKFEWAKNVYSLKWLTNFCSKNGLNFI